MGIANAIRSIDRGFGWSFLGFVLAAVFGGLAIYSEFFKDTAPDVHFEVVGNTPVLSVSENLPSLEVIYRGEDIAKAGKSVSVVLLRVVNRGTANLLKSHYDENAPLGMHLDNGVIVRAEILTASNDYLNTTASIEFSESGAEFGAVILEPSEWYEAKLLVMHKSELRPTILSHGKIAGLGSIPVVLSPTQQQPEGFLAQAFGGNLWVQASRLVPYAFGLVLLIVIVVIPVSSISDRLAQRSRRKIVEKFKRETELTISNRDEFIFVWFVDFGHAFLARMVRTASDKETLGARVQKALKNGRELDVPFDLAIEHGVYVRASDGSPVHHRVGMSFFKDMVESKFVVETDGEWNADPDKLRIANSLLDFASGTSKSDV